MGGPRNLSASEACFPMQTPSFCQEQSCLYGTRLPFRLQARAAVGASIGCKEASCPNRKNLTGSPAGLGRLWVCQQVSEKQVRKEEQWWDSNLSLQIAESGFQPSASHFVFQIIVPNPCKSVFYQGCLDVRAMSNGYTNF